MTAAAECRGNRTDVDEPLRAQAHPGGAVEAPGP